MKTIQTITFALTLFFTAHLVTAQQPNNEETLQSQSGIRVSNDNVTNIYSNAKCIGDKTGRVIHASKGGAGFSSWRKAKREGLPFSEQSLKENYSEYKIASDVPTIVESTTSRGMYNARNICTPKPFMFIPKAGHNYEVWLELNIDTKSCFLHAQELIYDKNSKILSQPIYDARKAQDCVQNN